jgi:hypothetical protein
VSENDKYDKGMQPVKDQSARQAAPESLMRERVKETRRFESREVYDARDPRVGRKWAGKERVVKVRKERLLLGQTTTTLHHAPGNKLLDFKDTYKNIRDI